MTPVDTIAQRPLVHRLRLKTTIAEIAGAVSAETGVPVAAILGTGRRADVAQARQRVMFLARQEGLSYPQIGYAIGRDHSTVLEGVRREAQRRGVAA